MAGGIDGVDDGIVGGRKDGVDGFFGKELLEFDDFGGGVDLADAIGHDAGFGVADVRGGCVELAVDIGDADIVHIDERDGADA